MREREYKPPPREYPKDLVEEFRQEGFQVSTPLCRELPTNTEDNGRLSLADGFAMMDGYESARHKREDEEH